ncbi:MAG: bifunctional 4-hydroxy-2-oxoglutarate aldolase/2-dehydro-3-deoxy-phosphogluconate aldolase [Beijerinckiaceae bacterium]|jgi:2-dehydro-3-deoxyphosphogluconate aldolase/(4S)-4-hydroxy-2-oxoglutarate aldolase|nr:bifunctional 4-hydroxy-2-oxoglutarate aldolase/2-dehydro-3-deoxy-phosphogluconate aldolase [Beijerinckiaceae bacterium]
MSLDLFAQIAAIGVVPVIAIDRVQDALPLADALLEGGLGIAEITFRTAAAADVLDILHRERPELIVGAGTVLDLASLNSAKAAGASFCLSPGFDAPIVDAAIAMGMPFAPGIMTPSELSGVVCSGLRFAKFFPAGIAGGPKALEGVAAPFAHLGVSFIPTGGVSPDTMGDWLTLPSVAAVGGTWIARSADIREGRFADITKLARAAVERVKAIREARK